MFEAAGKAQLEIQNSDHDSTITTAVIPCQQLRVTEAI